MDSFSHQVAERTVNHPLPLDAVLASKRCAFDSQREVALASGIIAAVAAVLLAIVDQFDARGIKR